MRNGLKRGTMSEHKTQRQDFAPVSLNCFIDEEGGYTTIAAAVALILSVTLIASLATAGWALARSADTQAVADSAAISATQVVGSYTVIVQVLNACVQTLGIAGMLLVGVGMVAAAVPGSAAVGTAATDAGIKVLQARRTLAQSAAQGLSKLEKILPLLCMHAATQTIEAQSTDSLTYRGSALPFPMQSESDFSSVNQEIDEEGLEETNADLAGASEKKEQYQQQEESSKEEAWKADCVPDSYCMRERAGKLGHLNSVQNPECPSVASWNFGIALDRARAYYAQRLANEKQTDPGIEGETDSAVRKTFYAYAEQKMQDGYYRELPDGTLEMDLPALPRDTDQMKETTLYTQSVWPTTDEGGTRVIHSVKDCPGATGAPSGTASLSQLDAGEVQECEVCRLTASAQGNVASATTNTQSGFEHYWRIIEEASKTYQQACEEEEQADSEVRNLAEEGSDRFDQALQILKTSKASLCPPGAWGCVAFAQRPQATKLPFTVGEVHELPPGIAISAAVLAEDNDEEHGSVLTHFADGWLETFGETGSFTQTTLSLWDSLLGSYRSGYNDLTSVADNFFDGIGGVLGNDSAQWLKDQLTSLLRDLDLQPADTRMRKPVLTQSGNVLTQAGIERSGFRDRLIELAQSGVETPEGVADAFGIVIGAAVSDVLFELARFTVPGSGKEIPLTIDLGGLL